MRVVNGCLHAMPSSLLHCAFLFLQFFCTVSSSFEKNDESEIAPSGCLFPAVSSATLNLLRVWNVEMSRCGLLKRHKYKNEVGCRDDTVPKTVDTRRHCEEE